MIEQSIPKGITAIVGSGGKTSLQNRLARDLARRGTVIITTSTHIAIPDCVTLLDPTPEQIREALRAHGLIAVGTPAPNGKLSGVDALWEELPRLADYVLVEADGSRQHPLKAPADHEPVIPRAARLVIAVAGMDGIGQPISQAAHRPALYARLTGKAEEDIVTPADAALVLCSEQGQRKGVGDSRRFAIVLNKADTQERLAHAQRVAEHIPYEIYITALQAGQPIIEHREARI